MRSRWWVRYSNGDMWLTVGEYSRADLRRLGLRPIHRLYPWGWLNELLGWVRGR